MNSSPIDKSGLPEWGSHRTYWHGITSGIVNTGIGDIKPSLTGVFKILNPNVSDPIFIIGQSRSGTTFLGSCISKVKEISYHVEPLFSQIICRDLQLGCIGERDAKQRFEVSFKSLMRSRLESNLRYAEKTPMLSSIMEELSKFFPEAQFINIVRDPRDQVASWRTRPNLRRDNPPLNWNFDGGWKWSELSPVQRAAMLWVQETNRTINVGRGLGPRRNMEFRYEDFVGEPELIGKQVLDFLGVDDLVSRSAFLRKALSAKSDAIGRWKKDLDEDEVRHICEIAGSLMREFRYL